MISTPNLRIWQPTMLHFSASPIRSAMDFMLSNRDGVQVWLQIPQFWAGADYVAKQSNPHQDMKRVKLIARCGYPSQSSSPRMTAQTRRAHQEVYVGPAFVARSR